MFIDRNPLNLRLITSEAENGMEIPIQEDRNAARKRRKERARQLTAQRIAEIEKNRREIKIPH